MKAKKNNTNKTNANAKNRTPKPESTLLLKDWLAVACPDIQLPPEEIEELTRVFADYIRQVLDDLEDLETA